MEETPRAFTSLDDISLDDIGFVKIEKGTSSSNTNTNCNIYNVSSNTRNAENRQEIAIQQTNLSSPPLCETSLQQLQQQKREATLERMKVYNLNR